MIVKGVNNKYKISTDSIIHSAFVSRLRLFKTNRQGVIAVMLALLLPVMVGFVGLGVEVGLWFQLKRDVQTAADAAAIAGAYEVLESSPTAATILAASSTDATLNGYDATTDTLTAVNPPTTGPNTGDDDAVEVNISTPVSLLFSSVFLDDSVTIAARAVASSEPGGDEACVLSLSDTSQGAVGIGGTVTMDGCLIAAQSTSSSSIKVSGGGDLTVDCLSTSGDVTNLGTMTLTECNSANIGVSEIADPYADLTMPAEVASSSDCDTENNPDGSGNYSLAQNDTDGNGVVVFCSNVSLSTGTYDFESGTTFAFFGADLSITGGTVTGDGVTFLFTGSGNSWGGVNIAGNANVDLSAQSTGDYAGMLFYQDGNASSNNNNFTFTGGSSTELTGVIYAPNNDVSFSGNNVTDDDGCLQVVADTVDYNGNVTITNQCDGTGVSAIYTSYTVLLIE